MIKSNLKKIMQERRVTYAKLQEMTGLSSQTITRARGSLIEECKVSTLKAIAQALNVRVKDLFDED